MSHDKSSFSVEIFDGALQAQKNSYSGPFDLNLAPSSLFGSQKNLPHVLKQVDDCVELHESSGTSAQPDSFNEILHRYLFSDLKDIPFA